MALGAYMLYRSFGLVFFRLKTRLAASWESSYKKSYRILET
jgi:hypothetical protein